MSKVVHLTSVHPPFDVRIFHKECVSLVRVCQDVVLVAPHERDEIRDGVRIKAVAKLDSKGRVHRMTCTVWRVCRAALEERARVYHFHDPELIPVGLWLRLRGAHVIYDVHEDLPCQILSKYWVPKPLRGILAKGAEMAEGVASRFLDAIVAAEPTIAARFPNKKTVLVQNFPISNELVSVEGLPYVSRPPWIVYVGGITVIRGVFEMVKAMEVVAEEFSPRLVLAGSFSPAALEEEVRRLRGWRRVEFLGWQSRQQVAHLLGRARAGLVLLHPTRKYSQAQPVKLFEYMSTCLPVIASDLPLLREIVNGTGCGLLVDPLDPQAIAEAIEYMLTHPEEAATMGRRGREAVESHYDWSFEEKKLLALYADHLGHA